MLKNYIKIAYKVFLRRKFFTFISLFAVSFTLIVLMVAVALFDHIFGPLPPETKLDRTLGVYLVEQSGERSRRNGPPGYGLLDRYARDLPNVEKFSIHSTPATVSSYKNGEKISSFLKRTDGEFWEILDFNFLEGGPYTAEDERNANFIAVINEATRRKFFGEEQAVGRTIEVDGQRFRVVGVVANVPIFRLTPFADIYVPISTAKSDSYKSEFVGEFFGTILARSADDFPAIKEEFKSRLAGVEFPDTRQFNKMSGSAETFMESVARFFSDDSDSEASGARVIAAMATLMLLFMLLPTVNLININVSRIMERASEIGVRKAFGASSWTLVGQFVVENILLTMVGGVIGFIGSLLVLRAITETGLIQYAEFHMNYRVFFYGLGTAIFFGLFSGVYPAWKMSRLNPVEALKGASR
jgi:putative ABC transport system permease protein